MSRRTALLPAALFAVLLGTTACKKNKPTTEDKQPPPDGLTTPDPGMPGGPGGPPGRPGRFPRPGDPNAGQPGDVSLPSPPQAPSLSGALARGQSQNNLKQIGLAFHNAADVYRTFPVGIADKNGKVGLSWRVAILPYIEQDNLYKQFKLDEPWDSEHNKKLIKMMPKTFAPPSTDANGYTYYRSFTGPDTVMPPATPRPGSGGQVIAGGVGLFNITDGTSNTILVAEAAEPVIWTKPDELPFDKTKPPKIGGVAFKDGANVVMCDTSTKFLPNSFGGADLSNAINRQDGMIINWPDK
jgi:hypothetical protein